jgi:hypothetical protein
MDPEIARRAAARELLVMDPQEAVERLAELIALARTGELPARAALAPLTSCLRTDPHLRARGAALGRAAEALGHATVASLFAEGKAQLEFDATVAAKSDAQAFSMTLGHLKSLARLTRDLDQLSRLSGMSNPTIVRNALLNPKLTEQGVVRMASKRPARPEPLLEIWASARWSSRHAVRRALAFNPYLPLEAGAKIVPLLGLADLRELAEAGSVQPSLRAQASILCEGLQRLE